jgi:hypothetical protein
MKSMFNCFFHVGLTLRMATSAFEYIVVKQPNDTLHLPLPEIFSLMPTLIAASQTVKEALPEPSALTPYCWRVQHLLSRGWDRQTSMDHMPDVQGGYCQWRTHIASVIHHIIHSSYA